MFLFFKNFLIIRVFILCTCAPLFAENTTPIDEQKVNAEIAPILEKYKNVLNAVDKYDRLTQEGIFVYYLRSLGRKAVKADALLEEKVELGYHMKNYEKVLRIIRAGSEIEGLVDKLYPLGKDPTTNEMIFGKPNLSYCDALNEMLTSKNERFTLDPFVCMVRQRLIDRNIEVKVFMKFARWLYNQYNEKIWHRMALDLPHLPEYNNVEEIEEMFEAVEIDRDIPAVVCMQIMLQPLDMPPSNTTVAPPSISTKK